MSLERLGHFVFRHRKAVMLAWLIIIIASGVAATMVSSVLSHGAYMPTSGEAVEGSQILEQELGIRPNVMIVVFSSETIRADDPQFMDEMDNALAGLHGIENLDSPITYHSSGNTQLISANGYTTYATIGIKGDSYTASELVSVVREELRPQPSLTMLVTGQPALSTDSEALAMDDMKKAEMYTFPVVAIVLLLVFGSLVAAGLPLAIGGASIVLTMGMVFLLGQYIDITSSCLTVVSFIGLGVGIDYSLLMVTRFREELRKGKVVEESLYTTIRTSGKAILFSALTSVIGLSALISFDNPMIRSLGIGGVIVVLLALAAGLTLIPALLATLGPRVNRLTLFHLSEQKGTYWQRLARWEMKHPAVVLSILIPLLALLILPLASLQLGYISYTVVPERAEARQGYEVLADEFCAGELSPIMVAVTTHSTILDADKVGALYDLTRGIGNNGEVHRIDSIVNLDSSITKEQYQQMYAFPDSIPDPQIRAAVDQLTSESTTLISVYGESDPTGPEAMELVSYIRNLEPEGLDIYVTGPAAMVKDAINNMYSHFPWVLLFIFAATYVSLFLLFKSILLPLKAIILNAVGVAAAFGVIVFIFQQGHFSGLLDFTAWGVIEASLPIIIFCIVFGLSMDYEVFLLTRIKESWDETHDNTTSVALGLARTGRVITSAALIMVVVFGSFLLTDLIYIKVIGLGLALAIFIDAAIIRVFMAPALMRIMGKWNWWAPAFLERLWTPRER